MEYKGLDFDGDKQVQYKELRLLMAKLYEETNASFFGPVNPVAPLPLPLQFF